ncbi:MAG: PIN domain nuclease [Acidobacteriota bacterium]
MIIVETTVWIDVLRGERNRHTAWLLRNALDPNLALTDLTFCEVLQGIPGDRRLEEARNMLIKVGVLETGGTDLALEAAEHYRFLRKRGITIRNTIDCLIATYCIRGKHDLLHHDRDYNGFEQYMGLRVIAP